MQENICTRLVKASTILLKLLKICTVPLQHGKHPVTKLGIQYDKRINNLKDTI